MIRSALAKAERDGMVGRNVARLAEPPALERKHRVESLTPTEAQKFLAAVEGHRLDALYSVALAIGLRRGEALGLEWSAVDLATGILRVTQTAQRIKGKGMLYRKAAKTDKSLRSVPLSAFAIALLQRHKARQTQEREFAGSAWIETMLVFTSSIGPPIEPSNLTRHFHATLDMLKIDRRRFHDLRHTAASLLLAQGASVDLVGSVLAPQFPVAPSTRERKRS